MMLQSCCTVFETFILSFVSFHSVLARVKLEKDLLLLGINFCGYAKEEAKQQRVTWMDFLTRKKNAKTFY